MRERMGLEAFRAPQQLRDQITAVVEADRRLRGARGRTRSSFIIACIRAGLLKIERDRRYSAKRREVRKAVEA